MTAIRSCHLAFKTCFLVFLKLKRM
uniref:Uncharacterized protein n=1 Tax=Arundo donax TaxID=35708 RepID=A0A0A9ESI7_ARUDO